MFRVITMKKILGVLAVILLDRKHLGIPWIPKVFFQSLLSHNRGL